MRLSHGTRRSEGRHVHAEVISDPTAACRPGANHTQPCSSKVDDNPRATRCCPCRWAHMEHSFLTASFPVHRLPVYIRRLCRAGYRVGVVRQVRQRPQMRLSHTYKPTLGCWACPSAGGGTLVPPGPSCLTCVRLARQQGSRCFIGNRSSHMPPAAPRRPRRRPSRLPGPTRARPSSGG